MRLKAILFEITSQLRHHSNSLEKKSQKKIIEVQTEKVEAEERLSLDICQPAPNIEIVYSPQHPKLFCPTQTRPKNTGRRLPNPRKRSKGIKTIQ